MNAMTSRIPARRLLLASLIAATLPATAASAAQVKPVLMVIANQDFHHAEYGASRASLEAQGLEVVVAAATTEVARPQSAGFAGQVQPDLALSDAKADDYSAIVFVGGWGAASYQYAFEGTYHHAAYRRQSATVQIVNDLINDFVDSDRTVAAICHGVTVLAWARVDGVSPLQGKVVVGAAQGMPGFREGGLDFPNAEYPARWQIEANGARMLTSGSIGNPLSSSDDVWIDGKIITAENYDSAGRFAEAIAQSVAARNR